MNLFKLNLTFAPPIVKPKTLSSLLRYEEHEPGLGALIYCQLGPEYHSGIYAGNGKAIHLRGNGNIEETSLIDFTNHYLTKDKQIFFPIDPIANEPYSCYEAFYRAIDMLGKKRNYHLLFDNCHQFCAGCIAGDFEEPRNFLWMAKEIFKEEVLVHEGKIKWIASGNHLI